jgi:hypothetical protein
MDAASGHTIDLKGIVVIVGNYGSGKTEVAINLAIFQKKAGMDVRVGDLDLVNPYFRTREARQILADRGIDLVLPPKEYLHADLPILPPEIAGMIRQPGELAILDAGGDDVGATVLAALADHLKGKTVQTLQVINPFRPFTDTIEGCLKIRREIEAAAKLTVTGLVGNANLIDDTAPSDIQDGYEFAKRLSAESGLPLVFITAATDIIPRIAADRFACPVLPINRQLVPPWRRSASVS